MDLKHFLAAGLFFSLFAVACSSEDEIAPSAASPGQTLALNTLPGTSVPEETQLATMEERRTEDYARLPLSDLSPEGVAYLASRQGTIGVSVVVPPQATVYSWNGEAQFHMASVAKVAIMLTLMNSAMEEGRDLTAEEMSYLRPMITISDNPTASALWNQIGGGEGIEKYLTSIGLVGINPNKDSCWGASYASADAAALLFATLAQGEILNPSMRQIALDLLQQVDPSQTWGVIASAPGVPPEGTILAVKDGWYPADCGWWVNSAGMLLPSNDKPAYTMAVLTGEQSTWEYGIETIEMIGAIVHKQLHGD